MSADSDKIARIAAEVIEELRTMGLANAPANFGADAPRPASTAAIIRPYGSSSAPAAQSAPTARSASASSIVAAAAAKSYSPPTGGSIRPEDPGLSPDGRPTVTCNVSNRHIHLSHESLEVLFGKGAELTPRNELMQPFQFAAQETVSLIAGRGRTIENVRILGPLRKYTQIEISRTDGFFLGIRPPVRASGDIKGSAGATLVGPKGTLVLKEGIIIADRHIHTPPQVASHFGWVDNQMIQARVFSTEKPTLLERMRIRISDEFLFEMHIDNDDANAAGVVSGDRMELLF